METFSSLLAICAGNSPVPGEFPTQRPVTRSFDVFFDLRVNKRLSKQSWGWWLETLSRPLWRHCNVICYCIRTFTKLCECMWTQLCGRTCMCLPMGVSAMYVLPGLKCVCASHIKCFSTLWKCIWNNIYLLTEIYISMMLAVYSQCSCRDGCDLS